MNPAIVIHDPGAQLSEGVVWDADRERLLWVDITAGQVHELVLSSGRRRLWQLGCDVGAVAPRSAGGLVVADRLGFGLLEEDCNAPLHRIADLLGPHMRMNDGACDPYGNFLAGSMAYDEAPMAGAVFRLDASGEVTVAHTDTTVSNGLGWSPRGDVVYFVDSAKRRVAAFDYRPDRSFADERAAVEIPPDRGVPDGLAVDAEGAIWVAQWGGWGVHRYSPDGALLAELKLPVAQVTSCAFGGTALDELYITTGAYRLTAAERREQPSAGAVFRCKPGVRGLPEMPYRG